MEVIINYSWSNNKWKFVLLLLLWLKWNVLMRNENVLKQGVLVFQFAEEPRPPTSSTEPKSPSRTRFTSNCRGNCTRFRRRRRNRWHHEKPAQNICGDLWWYVMRKNVVTRSGPTRSSLITNHIFTSFKYIQYWVLMCWQASRTIQIHPFYWFLTNNLIIVYIVVRLIMG